MMKKYEYIISACLCGDSCRYDAESKACPRAASLFKTGKYLKVCPEVLGGLPTPRTPCEIKNGRVITKTGKDKTEAFEKGAQAVLEICKKYGIKKAVLKQSSPSCGSRNIYDGSFTSRKISGMGVTAHLLYENGIEIFDENQI